MRMKQIQLSERPKLSSSLPAILFWITAAFSLCTTYYVTGHILDSDTSSTLVFAEHLAGIGKLFSQDWMYSTSIEVISSHLIYMPLFSLLDNWQSVRLIGTIILQALYVLSYAFMLRQAGVSKRVFYISATLILLPISVAHGRIVLYHCYYIPLLVVDFLMLGLVFRCAKVDNWKKPGPYLSVIALSVLSLLGGCGGIRQLMIAHAPMVLSAFLFCFLDFYKYEKKISEMLTSDRTRILFFSVLSAGASFVGFLVNVGYLCKRFTFADYGSTGLQILNFAELDDVLYGFFHQFGFREQVNMISAIGILSLLGLIAGIYCVYASIQTIKRYKKEDNICTTLLSTFFLFFTGVTLFSFLVTGGDSGYYYPLYFAFCISWAAPFLIISHEDVAAKKGFSFEKLFSWITVFTLLINGFANLTFFNGSKTFNQIYEGLTFYETDKKETLSGTVEYLTENDYQIGYATYWESNVLTEITNGDIRMINLFMGGEDGNLVYYNWLTSLYLREVENPKPFLLLPADFRQYFERSDSYQYCTLVYSDSYHCVYDILDREAFIPTLYS